jgi:hypothetical protein
MEFHYKPQTFLGSYMSTVRNSIITVSLGIGVYGYSKNFKKTSRLTMKILSVLIYLFSIGLIFNVNLLLKQYLDNFPNDKLEYTPSYFNHKIWRRFEILAWYLLSIYVIFASLGMFSIMKDLI